MGQRRAAQQLGALGGGRIGAVGRGGTGRAPQGRARVRRRLTGGAEHAADMGIDGLLPLLEDIMVPVDIWRLLPGKSVGVDSFGWLA